MDIIIGVVKFKTLTGAEIYCYELARELVKREHHVVIVSPDIGGQITEKVRECGVEVVTAKEHINFKPDLMHLQQYSTTQLLLARYPKIPVVATVHSEFPIERPFVSDRISKYICIRESIDEKVVKYDLIPKEKTIHIPNGFDTERFNTNYNPPNNERTKMLFVGTVDKLRQQSILRLVNFCDEFDFELQIVGARMENYLDGHPAEVEWINPDGGGIWNIEDYVKKCDCTAGILLGRTTIEGWLCGKPGIIFGTDIFGRLQDIKSHDPPADVDKYDIKSIVDRVEAVYLEAML